MDSAYDYFYKNRPNDISNALFYLLMGIKDFLEMFMENEFGRKFELNYDNILYYINTEFPITDQWEISEMSKNKNTIGCQEDVYNFLTNKVLEDRWFIIKFFKIDKFYFEMLKKEMSIKN